MLKRNIIANYLGQGWTALMGLAFIPLYIRYLGIESYGIIGIYAILNAWLQLANIGMTPTLNREMARYTAGAYTVDTIRDLLRSFEVIALAIAILLAGSVWLASDWLAVNWFKAESLKPEQMAHAIAVMGLVIVTKFLEGLYQGAILGLQKQIWYNVLQATFATLRGAGVLAALIWISPTIQVYFYWQGAISIITVLVYVIAIYHWLPKPNRPAQFSMSAVRPIWRFAGGMMVTTFLALLLTQVDKVLLSKLLTLERFGQYTLAATVSGGLYQIVSPITQAFYPRFTEYHTCGDNLALIKAYHLGAQLVTVTVGTVATVLIVYAENILRLWTGDKSMAVAVAPLLTLLTLGTFLNTLMHIPYMLQLAYGWSGFGAKVNMVAVMFLVPAILWVVPRYGAEGAAMIWVLLNFGYITISIYLMHRRLLPNEKWRWYGQDIVLPSVVATGLMLTSFYTMSADLGKVLEIAWIVTSAIGGLFFATLSATSLRNTVMQAWSACTFWSPLLPPKH